MNRNLLAKIPPPRCGRNARGWLIELMKAGTLKVDWKGITSITDDEAIKLAQRVWWELSHLPVLDQKPEVMA